MIEFVKSAAVFLGAMALGAALVVVIAAIVTARDEAKKSNGEDK